MNNHDDKSPKDPDYDDIYFQDYIVPTDESAQTSKEEEIQKHDDKRHNQSIVGRLSSFCRCNTFQNVKIKKQKQNLNIKALAQSSDKDMKINAIVIPPPKIPKDYQVANQSDRCFRIKDIDIEHLYRRKLDKYDAKHGTTHVDALLTRDQFIEELQQCLCVLHNDKKRFIKACARLEQLYATELNRLYEEYLCQLKRKGHFQNSHNHPIIHPPYPQKDLLTSAFDATQSTPQSVERYMQPRSAGGAGAGGLGSNETSPGAGGMNVSELSLSGEQDANPHLSPMSYPSQPPPSSIFNSGDLVTSASRIQRLEKTIKGDIETIRKLLAGSSAASAAPGRYGGYPREYSSLLDSLDKSVRMLLRENRKIRDYFEHKSHSASSTSRSADVATADPPTRFLGLGMVPVDTHAPSNQAGGAADGGLYGPPSADGQGAAVAVAVRQLEGQLQAKSRELGEVVQTFSNLQKDVLAREERLREERRRAEEALEEALAHQQTMREELSRVRMESGRMHLERDRLKGALESLQHVTTAMEEGHQNELRQQIKVLETLLQEERDQRVDAEERVRGLEVSQQDVQGQLSASHEKNRMLKEESASLQSQLRISQARVHELSLSAAAAMELPMLHRQDKEALNLALNMERERVLTLETEVEQLRLECQQERLRTAHRREEEQVAGFNVKLEGELERLRECLNEQEHVFEYQRRSWEEMEANYQEELRKGEARRREMHNLIQELRGNVRIFARVRPDDREPHAVSLKQDLDSLVIAPPSGNANNSPQMFTFDRIFGPRDGQEDVFSEVQNFVQSALDGYAVCLFSYGQTGSGKTHTMMGVSKGRERGIIPRAMEQIGQYKLLQERKGWRFVFEVSYLEIYLEQIRDLLTDSGEDIEHKIRKNPVTGQEEVTNLIRVELDPNDTDVVYQVIDKATRARATGSTDMNERSSRSHSVFSVKIAAKNDEQGISLRGSLDLVDLAGSERLDKSNATGDRQKETRAINTSLSHLTVVFNAIASKQSHVPFRNSKLTHILKPALSGDGKTMMMINLSPTFSNFSESLNTLRFAQGVSQLELGRAKKQVSAGKGLGAPSRSSARLSGKGASSGLNASKLRALNGNSSFVMSNDGGDGGTGIGSTLDDFSEYATMVQDDDCLSVVSDLSDEGSLAPSVASRASRAMSVVSAVSGFSGAASKAGSARALRAASTTNRLSVGRPVQTPMAAPKR